MANESDIEFTDRIIEESRALADRLTIGSPVPPRPHFPVLRAVAELEALPDRAVVRDTSDRSWLKNGRDPRGSLWWNVEFEGEALADSIVLPVLLIWHPSWNTL